MNKNIFLTIGMFALGLDAYVIAGILPDIGLSLGTGEAQNAQAVTVFTLFYAVAAPVFATILSKAPVRRILTIALTIFTVANIGSAFSSSLSMLLVFRALAGIGAGLFSPIAATAATATTPPHKKGRALGLILGGMSTGTVIGVPIGLWLSHHLGWRSTLWLVTAIGLLGLIGIVLKYPDIVVPAPPSFRQRMRMLTSRSVTLIVLTTFFTAFASLGLYTFIDPVVRDLGVTGSTMVYISAWGIGGMIGSFGIGHLIDLMGRPARTLAGILLLLTAVMILLPPVLDPLPVMALVLIIIWGACGWSSLAPQQHTLLRLQPQHGAAAVALNSSFNYLGGSVGTLVGGVALHQGLTAGHLPWFFAGFALVAFALQIYVLVSVHQGRED